MYGKTEQHICHMLKGLSYFCLNCYEHFDTQAEAVAHELANGYDHAETCAKLFSNAS